MGELFFATVDGHDGCLFACFAHQLQSESVCVRNLPKGQALRNEKEHQTTTVRSYKRLEGKGYPSTAIHFSHTARCLAHLPPSQTAMCCSQFSSGLIFFRKIMHEHSAKSENEICVPMTHFPCPFFARNPAREPNAFSTSFHALSRSSPFDSISSNLLPNVRSVRLRKWT